MECWVGVGGFFCVALFLIVDPLPHLFVLFSSCWHSCSQFGNREKIKASLLSDLPVIM